ncbi:hypothetical protein MiSe_51570 [Microseira wollei NIES-4236]|uniref:Uncharacterized protein n=1 Tax=Microseira wollei NIES-4236 TaxID=2530354 RepID=A0AAV3XFR9_9CYAN|nr:hypothetical protein MiSe_51570 [Microseira wollei NIES-4236]
MASKTLCVQGGKIRGGNCPAESTTQKYTDSSNPKAVVVTVKPSYKDGVSTHFSDDERLLSVHRQPYKAKVSLSLEFTVIQ